MNNVGVPFISRFAINKSAFCIRYSVIADDRRSCRSSGPHTFLAHAADYTLHIETRRTTDHGYIARDCQRQLDFYCTKLLLARSFVPIMLLRSSDFTCFGDIIVGVQWPIWCLICEVSSFGSLVLHAGFTLYTTCKNSTAFCIWISLSRLPRNCSTGVYRIPFMCSNSISISVSAVQSGRDGAYIVECAWVKCECVQLHLVGCGRAHVFMCLFLSR